MFENEAENEVEETSQDDSSAEHQEEELSVPKHRLDAVSAELRRLKEENRAKDEALRQMQGSFQPHRQAEESDEDELEELEQMGVDKKVVKALQKHFEKKSEKKIQAAEQKARGMIVGLANKVEESGFIAEYGKGAGKYLGQIKELRQQHAQQGSFLSVEMAYKLIVADETLAKLAKPSKAPVQKATETKVATEVQKSQKAAQPQGRSIEDWENELDEQIKKG